MNNYNEVFQYKKEKQLRRSKNIAKIVRILTITMLCGYIFISIYPFLWALIASFTNPAMISDMSFFPVDSFNNLTTKNYGSFLNSDLTRENALRWISNSVIYSVSNATINCFFNFLAGYALARISFKGKKFIIWYIIVALMVPVQATQIPQLIILVQIGIINANTPDFLWFIGILSTGMTSGVLIFMVRQFYVNQSKSVEESAKIEGLSTFGVFFKVSLRLLRPLLALQWTMVFMGSWNNFIMFTMWAVGEDSRLSLVSALTLLSNTATGYESNGRALAATNLSVLPVLLVYMISLRFQKSINIEGEK